MDITLSPDDVTKVNTSFSGGDFSFEIKHFTFNEQVKYAEITDEAVKKKKPIKDWYQERWDFAIQNCTLEDPISVLSQVNIQTILMKVNDVNNGVYEKKS